MLRCRLEHSHWTKILSAGFAASSADEAVISVTVFS
jgi:hypothetical protein